MTRKEEIRNKANGYAFDLDEGDLNTNRDTFIDGAEWADKTMIDKACEWLHKRTCDFFVEQFKKAMEE